MTSALPVPTEWPGYAGFRRWISERHQITELRRVGARWPWTTDPLFRELHFCNVFRELDRGSVHAIALYGRAWPSWGVDSWFLAAIVRFLNLPETLDELEQAGLFASPDAWEPLTALDLLRARAARKEKVFAPAYVIAAAEGSDKPGHLVRNVWGPMWDYRHHWRHYWSGTDGERVTVARTVERLQQHAWVGGFLAYEIASDLTYLPLLAEAPDRATYANLGPGALRGLKLVFGPLAAGRKPYPLFEALLAAITGDQPTTRPLLARDVEHSLCEFYKYERARLGVNPYRRRYQGAPT